MFVCAECIWWAGWRRNASSPNKVQPLWDDPWSFLSKQVCRTSGSIAPFAFMFAFSLGSQGWNLTRLKQDAVYVFTGLQWRWRIWTMSLTICLQTLRTFMGWGPLFNFQQCFLKEWRSWGERRIRKILAGKTGACKTSLSNGVYGVSVLTDGSSYWVSRIFSVSFCRGLW